MFTLVPWEKQQQGAKWFIHYSGSFILSLWPMCKKDIWSEIPLYAVYHPVKQKCQNHLSKSLLFNLERLFTQIISCKTAVILAIYCFVLNNLMHLTHIFVFCVDTWCNLQQNNLRSPVEISILTSFIVFPSVDLVWNQFEEPRGSAKRDSLTSF